MTFTRHFFIEGSYLGHAKVGLQWARHSTVPTPPIGHFFFCPACSRLWAECPVENRQSMVWAKACKNHKPGEFLFGHGPMLIGGHSISSSDPPGSILLDWEEAFTASFPPTVIAWELRQHLIRAILTGPENIASLCRDIYNFINP